MSKTFVYLHHIEEPINEFDISYMVHPIFHVNKSFKEHMEKCMNDEFGTITKLSIKNSMKKKNTCVLAVVIFYETRHKNTIKYF